MILKFVLLLSASLATHVHMMDYQMVHANVGEHVLQPHLQAYPQLEGDYVQIVAHLHPAMWMRNVTVILHFVVNCVVPRR